MRRLKLLRNVLYEKIMLEQIFVEGNIVYIIFIGIASIAFHFKKRWLRYPIMLAALACIGFLQMGCPSPSRAIQFIFDNITKLETQISFGAKLLIVLLSAVFFGKIFCGWVCPKGTIQEFLFQKTLSFKVPPTLDNVLRKLKYVILALIILLPLVFHYKPFNSDTSAFAVIFNLDGSYIAIALLATILFASLFIYRPYCRYVCPTGAMLALVSYVNRVKFRSRDDCTFCEKAAKKCGIGAMQAPKKTEDQCFSVDKGECIMCGECRNNCPKGLSIRCL